MCRALAGAYVRGKVEVHVIDMIKPAKSVEVAIVPLKSCSESPRALVTGVRAVLAWFYDIAAEISD